MDIISQIEKENLKSNAPVFNIGDTVKVYFKVIEGEKERTQVFEGVVIARKNGAVRETFTVRKNSFGIGVEKTFPVHSPKIEKVEIVKSGKVRRAKLYYLRELTGKKAKLKEKDTRKKITKVKTETAEVKATEPVKTETVKAKTETKKTPKVEAEVKTEETK